MGYLQKSRNFGEIMSGQSVSEKKVELPKLGPNATKGQLGEALVEAAILSLGHLYERRSGLDFGVDGVIEFTLGGNHEQASGRQVGVQVKRGLSNAVETRYGFTHYCSEAHANYWLRHSLPIIIVHSDPSTERLRWRQVSEDSLRRTPKGYAIDLPPESELRNSLEEVRTLSESTNDWTSSAGRTFVLPWSIREGVRIGDADLGLAALEFSRAILRGEEGQVLIDLEEEPDLVADIDAVRDRTEVSADIWRDALIRADILARYQKETSRRQRALRLLLTEKRIVEFFGYQDQLLSEAITYLMHPNLQHREKDDVKLQAWPAAGHYEPTINFDVPKTAMEELYAKDNGNRVYMRMGDMGGMLIGDINPDVVAGRFIPMLSRYLINYAEAIDTPDDHAFEHIGVPPSMWRVGLG